MEPDGKPLQENLEHALSARYNMILGKDLIRELGIELDFKENSITWGNYQADMKSADFMLA
eukprot:11520028-Ditylum_brightwellii.AAC.1